MSYSFMIQAPNKLELLAQFQVKFEEVVAQQPVHATERESALQFVTAFLAYVEPTHTTDIALSVNGSTMLDNRGITTAVGMGINVYRVVRPADSPNPNVAREHVGSAAIIMGEDDAR